MQAVVCQVFGACTCTERAGIPQCWTPGVVSNMCLGEGDTLLTSQSAPLQEYASKYGLHAGLKGFT